MPLSIEQKLDRILRRVERPGRYVGGETNQVLKPPGAVKASVALAFPDSYDIGMSYHGYKILYELVNKVPSWAAERTFAPWPDMEALMREAGIPLFALESKRPVREFDLIGFSLQHEVNYTNILNMIDLAGLPVLAAERRDPFPLIVGGGEGALAPEPMAPFVDLFVLGDGETPLRELLTLVEGARSGKGIAKDALLREAARIEGVYVPSLYEMTRGADGRMKRFFAVERPDDAEPVVLRKALYDIRCDLGAVRPIVPNLRVVHDRFAIEIKRGCTRGCRFCAAGMITRPVRERVPDQIVEIARRGVESTGFDEVSLLSLSSADYSCILPTARLLREEFKDEHVAISMPSLRINAFDVSLAEEIAQVRKTGFTFAPEAGSDRLRRVINKPVDEASFLRIIEKVCEKGWKTLKFYFMIGLPTETDADLDGIVALVHEAERIGRRHWGNALQINVGLSPYVPKPHTPFQWAAQPPLEELERRYQRVVQRLRSKRISVKTHDRRMSMIEAVLARGDRQVGMAMLRAWQLGAKFDGWDEHFRFDAWMQAFDETGIDPAFYAHRQRDEDEAFPWDHIETGLGKTFLHKEWKLANREREVPDCSTHGCVGCHVCDDVVDHRMADEVWKAPEPLLMTEGRYEDFGQSAKLARPELRRARNGTRHGRLTQAPSAARGLVGAAALAANAMESAPAPESRPRAKKRPPRSKQPPVQRLLFRFSRTGDQKYLSHLDIMKIMQMACRRAGLKPAYTEGFNPKPRMRFLPPLPLGYQTFDDACDMDVAVRVEPREALRRFRGALPPGVEAFAVEEIPMRSDPPEVRLLRSEFSIRAPADVVSDLGLSLDQAVEAIHRFEGAVACVLEKPAKKGRAARSVDLKRIVETIEASVEDDGSLLFALVLSHIEGEHADPLSALNTVLGAALRFEAGVDVARKRVDFAPVEAGRPEEAERGAASARLAAAI